MVGKFTRALVCSLILAIGSCEAIVINLGPTQVSPISVPAAEALSIGFQPSAGTPDSTRALLFRYSPVAQDAFLECRGLGLENTTTLIDSDSPYTLTDGYSVERVGQKFYYAVGLEERVETTSVDGLNNSVVATSTRVTAVLCLDGYKAEVVVVKQNDPGNTAFFLIAALGVGGALGVCVVIGYAATKRRDLLDTDEHRPRNPFNLFSITEKTGESDASYERHTHSAIHDRMALRSGKGRHRTRSFRQIRSKPNFSAVSSGDPKYGSGVGWQSRAESSGSVSSLEEGHAGRAHRQGSYDDVRKLSRDGEPLSGSLDRPKRTRRADSGAGRHGETKPATRSKPDPPTTPPEPGEKVGLAVASSEQNLGRVQPIELARNANSDSNLGKTSFSGKGRSRGRRGRRRAGSKKEHKRRMDARALLEQGKRTARLHKSDSPVMLALEEFVGKHHPMLSSQSVHLHCRNLIVASGGSIRQIVNKLNKEYGEAPDLLINEAVEEVL